MRLQGAKSRMEGGRARGLLKSMSIKQGIKYDAPESAKDIPTFIEFHNLDVTEILDPLDSFSACHLSSSTLAIAHQYFRNIQRVLLQVW